jgi:hypothetical protein
MNPLEKIINTREPNKNNILRGQEEISLDSSTAHILEECRMVLPGIQALFGFQLIAVFNEGFGEKLSSIDQRLHLLSIVLVIMSIILVMAPAALHRRTQPRSVSNRFIEVSSGLLLWGMLILSTGICLEVYLISNLILKNLFLSVCLSVVLFILFIGFWLALPCREKKLKSHA